MRENRKRPGVDAGGEASEKRARTPVASEDKTGDSSCQEGDTLMALFSFNDGEIKKRARTPATSEETADNGSEEGNMTATSWFSIFDDEKSVAELAKLLEEAAEASPAKVRFIDDPYCSLPVVFQWSPLHITINGNEESCGSSFSDSDSSVMASVDVGCLNRRVEWTPAETGAACGADGGVRLGGASEVGEVERATVVNGVDGCDCFDDESLLTFFGEEMCE